MRTSTVSCDTSVLVPALHQLQPDHEVCREVLGRVGALPAQVILESYRILTGVGQLPALAPAMAMAALEALDLPSVTLPPGEYLKLTRLLANAGRSGGAIYDAQIAATAKHHGLTLLSRDHRATSVYALVGVDYELI